MEKDRSPQVVNTWKPVTGEWKESGTSSPDASRIAAVESSIAAADVVPHGARNPRAQTLISLYSFYCILSALSFLVCVFSMSSFPGSEVSKSIYAGTLPAIERIFNPASDLEAMQSAHTLLEQQQADEAHQQAIRVLPNFFLAWALFYLIAAVMWKMRNTSAGLVTMLCTGFSAAAGLWGWCLARFAFPGLLSPFDIHSSRADLLLPIVVLNGAVCLYLAFSPSVLKAVRDSE